MTDRQNYSGRRKPDQLTAEDIFNVARSCSYDMACRTLRVSRHQFEPFIKNNYPDIHEQFLLNGRLRKYSAHRGKWN